MTPVTRPFDAVLARIRQEMTDQKPDMAVVEALASIGREVIERAAESKRTGNDLMNQMEAFGYGVFFNGECVRQGYLDKSKYRGDHRNKDGRMVKGAEPDRKRHRMGRSMALHDIRDHKPDHTRYELYIVNAMWYSAIHEAWGLKIISQEIIHAVQEIAQKFGVDVKVDTNIRGEGATY